MFILLLVKSMKKVVSIIIFIFILIIIINVNREKTESVINIEEEPYDYYVIDFKGKVNLDNFKNIIDKIQDKKIERVYYNNKIYKYSTYEDFIKHLSEDSSIEENAKYLLEGIQIDKILIYTTKYNYYKLYNVVLNL